VTADDRRSFLGRVVLWGTGAFGALLAMPVAGYLTDPLRRSSVASGLTPVARLDALAQGVATRVSVRGAVRDAWTRAPARLIGAAWLLRTGNDVQAWSAVCPHLGCAVDHADGGFACPCHDSVFGADGRRRSGPSPRDMDALDVEIQGGAVLLRYVRYRKGIAGREAIG